MTILAKRGERIILEKTTDRRNGIRATFIDDCGRRIRASFDGESTTDCHEEARSFADRVLRWVNSDTVSIES